MRAILKVAVGRTQQHALVRIVRVTAETSRPLLVNVATVERVLRVSNHEPPAALTVRVSTTVVASPFPDRLHARLARLRVQALLAGLVLTTGAHLRLLKGWHQR